MFNALLLLAFPAVAFLSTFLLTRKSLGASISAMCGFGYFSGVVRANFLSPFTTFMFDMAVLGLYFGVFINRPDLVEKMKRGPLISWLLPLTLWPLIVAAFPVNDILVQLLAFRNTVWLLPIMLFATRISEHDMKIMANAFAGLNLLALAAGLYCYYYGVEALYPKNAVTTIIYASRDVMGRGMAEAHHRIPSLFLSSAAYGGTMVASLPYLVCRLFHPQANGTEKLWMFAGVAAAAIGVVLCASRSPVVGAAIILLVVWIFSGFSIRVGVPIMIGVLAIAFLVSSNDRFQRLASLGEENVMVNRFKGSVNLGFVDLFFKYPFGAGMGTAWGTSIPYFLASRAPKQIGVENEYGRIMIDQGWIGLFLWVCFIVWVHFPLPRLKGSRANYRFGTIMFYAASLTSWCIATIGAGTLAAVPAASMLLINMGIIVARRQDATAVSQRAPSRFRRPAPQQAWQADL